jgi:hypothetical protein
MTDVGNIVLIMALVLLVPTVLFYTMAPDEPLQEGVTIFSEGRQRVYLADPARYRQSGYQQYCVLEPHVPLTIVQPAADRPDGLILAKAQGRAPLQAPFCPPQAEVTLRSHQVRQKENLLRQIRDNLARLL